VSYDGGPSRPSRSSGTGSTPRVSRQPGLAAVFALRQQRPPASSIAMRSGATKRQRTAGAAWRSRDPLGMSRPRPGATSTAGRHERSWEGAASRGTPRRQVCPAPIGPSRGPPPGTVARCRAANNQQFFHRRPDTAIWRSGCGVRLRSCPELNSLIGYIDRRRAENREAALAFNAHEMTTKATGITRSRGMSSMTQNRLEHCGMAISDRAADGPHLVPMSSMPPATIASINTSDRGPEVRIPTHLRWIPAGSTRRRSSKDQSRSPVR